MGFFWDRDMDKKHRDTVYCGGSEEVPKRVRWELVRKEPNVCNRDAFEVGKCTERTLKDTFLTPLPSNQPTLY